MASLHPSFEELLLWHSREITGSREREIQLHVSSCVECQVELTRIDEVFCQATQITDQIARSRQAEVLQQWKQNQNKSGRKRFFFGTAATVLGTAVIVLMTLDLTPSAKAATLLQKATQRERVLQNEHQYILIRGNGQECSMFANQLVAPRRVSVQTSQFCDSVSEKLRSVGWTSNPLSAEGFQKWRITLNRKKDSVQENNNQIFLTTETEENSLRKATLTMNSDDYHVSSGSFEFISPEGMEMLNVTEQVNPPQMIAEEINPSVTPDAPPAMGKNVLPSVEMTQSIDPLDESELQVRAALHQLNLDSDVLISVERSNDVIQIYGVVESESDRHNLVHGLGDSSWIQFHIGSSTSVKVPWDIFQGNQPPLAYEHLNSIFPVNSLEREKYVNRLTTTSRKLAGMARMRDGALGLSQKKFNSEQKKVLLAIAADLERQISIEKRLIAKEISIIAGPMTVSSRPLSAADALSLYHSVHTVVFMSHSDQNNSLSESLQKISQLLQ